MSEIQEMQDEEREALISIYEGDAAFKQVNPTTYQYKVDMRMAAIGGLADQHT